VSRGDSSPYALRSALEEAGGTVTDLHIPSDRDSGRPRGFAFAEMSNDAEAQAVTDARDGKELEARNLTPTKRRASGTLCPPLNTGVPGSENSRAKNHELPSVEALMGPERIPADRLVYVSLAESGAAKGEQVSTWTVPSDQWLVVMDCTLGAQQSLLLNGQKSNRLKRFDAFYSTFGVAIEPGTVLTSSGEVMLWGYLEDKTP
jgi:RNA recognition motif-containing protein